MRGLGVCFYADDANMDVLLIYASYCKVFLMSPKPILTNILNML